MANSPAKNITSLPSHTITPTATVFGRLTIGAPEDWSTDALLTAPLCRGGASHGSSRRPRAVTSGQCVRESLIGREA